MLRVWDGWVSIAMLVDQYEAAVEMGIGLLILHGRNPPLPHRISLSMVEVHLAAGFASGANVLASQFCS